MKSFFIYYAHSYKINLVLLASALLFTFNNMKAQSSLGGDVFTEGFGSGLTFNNMKAQCSLGDAVFTEDFGSGTTRLGPSLNQDPNNVHPNFRPADLYTYIGSGSVGQDQYGIMKNPRDAAPGGAGWNDDFTDHTGNANGYLYYCDAKEDLNVFYAQKISGVCPEIEYELSAWFAKTNAPNYYIDPNIKLIVGFTDSNDNDLGVVDTDTGPIEGIGANRWHRKTLVFTIPVNTENVYFMLKNNVSGVAGNDLAIDDIQVRPCGPQVEITNLDTNIVITENTTICLNDPNNLNISISSDISTSDFVMQWQESVTPNIWSDIPNKTTNVLDYNLATTTNSLHKIRVKFAHSLSNLLNSNCYFFSEEIHYSKTFLTPVQNLELCDNLDDLDDTNGIAQTFDLASQTSTIVGANQIPSDFTVTYHLSQDDADNGDSPLTSPYTNILNPQTIYTRVENIATGCFVSSLTFKLIVDPLPIANAVPDLFECDNLNDSDDTNGVVQNFNLESQTSTILGTQLATDFTVTYHLSNAEAISGTNPLISPHANNLSANSQTIFVRVQNNITGCVNPHLTFNVVVNPLPIANTVLDLELCDNLDDLNDTNGIVQTFNLESQTSTILGTAQSSSDYKVTYHLSSADALSGNNPVNSPYTNISTPQTVYARVLNLTTGCINTHLSYDLIVHPLPVVNTIVELKQCDNNTDGISLFNLSEANILISSDSANETFTYYLTESEAQTGLVANQITNYINYPNPSALNSQVFARIENVNGCYRTAQINLVVGVSQIPASFNTLVYTVCDDEQIDGDKRNGIVSFDFSDSTQKIRDLFTLQNFKVTYYNNEEDALAEINTIVDISNHRNEGYPNTQNIYVRLDSDVVNACLGLGHHITLNVEKLPTANPVSYIRQCDDNPLDTEITSEFDTSNFENDLLLGQKDVTVLYFKEDGSPLTDINGVPILSPFPSSFRTASQTITAKVTNNLTNTNNNVPCGEETTIEFIVDESPIAHPVFVQPVCDDESNDGFYDFDTSTIQATILGSQIGMEIQYFDQLGTELPSPLPNPFTTNTQTISVQVINPLNTTCIATSTIDFIVNPLPNFEIIEPEPLCITEPPSTITLEVYQDDPNEVLAYEWKGKSGTIIPNGTTANVSESGTYFVTLTKTDGSLCARTKSILVTQSEVAHITQEDIIVEDDSDNNTITILTDNLGIGDYEFALDDPYFYQDEPFFNYVEAGIHTIFIQDKNNCGVSQIEVSVIGFPKFMTPNNDGFNDTWNVLGIDTNKYPTAKVYIFDRFGKLITVVDSDSEGWDGYYNGESLPSTDYWFSVELIDANGAPRIRKGHFTLIRK